MSDCDCPEACPNCGHRLKSDPEDHVVRPDAAVGKWYGYLYGKQHLLAHAHYYGTSTIGVSRCGQSFTVFRSMLHDEPPPTKSKTCQNCARAKAAA